MLQMFIVCFIPFKWNAFANKWAENFLYQSKLTKKDDNNAKD